MSASIASPQSPVMTQRVIHTSFVGLARGELRKILHLRVTWVVFAVITLLVIGGQLLLISGPTTSADMLRAPLEKFNNLMEGDIAIVRIFSGIFMLILAAHVVGLEYQYGTIRVLLARGVGRLQLLSAKVAALTLVGFVVLLVELLIELAFAIGLTLNLADGAQPWKALGAEFWADLRFYLFYLALNLVVTMLLAVAASVVGRSLAFGLAVGLSWFAVDSLLTIPLSLLARFTHSDFWLKVSGVLLGPLLNRLPDYLAPAYHEHGQTLHDGGFGPTPLVHVPGGQALAIIGAYTAIFIVVAVTLTMRREALD